MKIPVVFGTDENYIFPTFVVISSLLQSAHENTEYDIYIQTTKECCKRCMEMKQYLYRKYQNFDFHTLEIDNNIFKKTKVNNIHVKLPTYYRLIAAEQLSQYDRCIVLDSDILIQDDLTELFHWELGGNYIAGVKSWEDQQPTRLNLEHMINDGLPSMDQYIYMGGLLMNLAQIRRDNITGQFLEHMEKGYLSDDQDVFNICCYGKISFLPLRYNLLIRHYKEKFPDGVQIYSDAEIYDAWEHPAIIHYPGRFIKPWKNNKVKCGKEWWNAAKIFDETEEYMMLRNTMEEWTKRLEIHYIVEHIPVGSSIVIFGFSDIGKQVYHRLLNMNQYKIIGFCDNDTSKWGKTFENVSVCSIDQMIYTQQKCAPFFVISSQADAAKIQDQLIKEGICEDKIFVYHNLDETYLASINY